jgi:hypothetical protein
MVATPANQPTNKQTTERFGRRVIMMGSLSFLFLFASGFFLFNAFFLVVKVCKNRPNNVASNQLYFKV